LAFDVTYVEDMPQDCWRCPCSVAVSRNEVYCHSLKQQIEVRSFGRPDYCTIRESEKFNSLKEAIQLSELVKHIYKS